MHPARFFRPGAPAPGGLSSTVTAVLMLATAATAGCAARASLGGAGECAGPFAPGVARAAEGTGLALLTPAERLLPVAEIGGRVITLAEYQGRLDGHSPERRARYAEEEARRELLDQLVRFELLAMAAYRRGLASDPSVSLATKEALVRRLLTEGLDATAAARDVPESELRWYYEEHRAELRRPAEVRAGVIVMADPSAAGEVRLEAVAAGDDEARWRALVEQHSIDAASREVGGDLGWFARAADGGPVDAALSDAAFALAEVGEVGPVVETEAGACVLRLTDRREGSEPAFEKVREEIARRIARERRMRALEAYLAEVAAEVDVRVYPENLSRAKVVLEAAGK